jgi:hypothetical protein
MEVCRTVRPDLQMLSSSQEVACHLYTGQAGAEPDAILLEPANGAKRRA